MHRSYHQNRGDLRREVTPQGGFSGRAAVLFKRCRRFFRKNQIFFEKPLDKRGGMWYNIIRQVRRTRLKKFKQYRDVAQLVARLLWEQDVAGSNPVIPTISGGIAQLVRVLA